jgi:hypothetical protein
MDLTLSTMPGRWARLAAGASLALVLAVSAGCTMMRLGYAHLDTFAVSMADDYFDLEPTQKHEFNTRFERLHDWHRREQLPEYAAFLKEATARLHRGVTREDVAWMLDGLDERYRAIARRGADDAIALLLTVTPAQIEVLQRRWERDNAKFVREHRLNRGAEEQRSERVKRTVKQIEEWAGDLSEEQEQKIAAISHRPPSIERARHEERLRRQGEFLKVMELRGNREAFAQRLRHWLLHWEEGRTPEQAKLFRQAREKRIEIYVATANMLTPAQRTHLTSRVQGYIGDFTRLAEPAKAKGGRRKEEGKPFSPSAFRLPTLPLPAVSHEK